MTRRTHPAGEALPFNDIDLWHDSSNDPPVSPSNLEVLASEATDLGPTCLRRRELMSSPGTVVTEITLDNQFLMSSLYTASEEARAGVADWLFFGTGS